MRLYARQHCIHAVGFFSDKASGKQFLERQRQRIPSLSNWHFPLNSHPKRGNRAEERKCLKLGTSWHFDHRNVHWKIVFSHLNSLTKYLAILVKKKLKNAVKLYRVKLRFDIVQIQIHSLICVSLIFRTYFFSFVSFVHSWFAQRSLSFIHVLAVKLISHILCVVIWRWLG